MNEGETELVKWDTGNPFVLVVNHPTGTPETEVTKTVCFWTEGGWVLDVSVWGNWSQHPWYTGYAGVYVNGTINAAATTGTTWQYGGFASPVWLAKGCHELQFKAWFESWNNWVGTVTFGATAY